MILIYTENILKDASYFVLSAWILNWIKSEKGDDKVQDDDHRFSTSNILDTDIELWSMFANNQCIRSIQESINSITQENKELKVS